MREPDKSTSATKPLRLLIVDDNRDTAESLGMLLELMGHEVRTAHDGLAAIADAAESKPDAILLDIGLPKLNGYDTARRIREQDWGRSLHLIAVTGWGQDADRTRAKEAGFDHHLTKPIDIPTLMKLLEGGRDKPRP
jgi:CheY-like chemotaxis protein